MATLGWSHTAIQVIRIICATNRIGQANSQQEKKRCGYHTHVCKQILYLSLQYVFIIGTKESIVKGHPISMYKVIESLSYCIKGWLHIILYYCI